MNHRFARRVAALALLAGVMLVVAAPAAEAKKRPSNRARIHHLEKRLTALRARESARDARITELEQRLGELAAKLSGPVGALLDCPVMLPVNAVTFTPPGAVDAVTILAGTPVGVVIDQFMVVADARCAGHRI